MNDENAPIFVSVERIVYGHNARLGQARIVSGPAYVIEHTDGGTLETLAINLALAGHQFHVTFSDRHVSILEYMGVSL